MEVSCLVEKVAMDVWVKDIQMTCTRPPLYPPCLVSFVTLIDLFLSSFHEKAARPFWMKFFLVVEKSTEGDISYLNLSHSIVSQMAALQSHASYAVLIPLVNKETKCRITT
jgi:hypothetical protein